MSAPSRTGSLPDRHPAVDTSWFWLNIWTGWLNAILLRAGRTELLLAREVEGMGRQVLELAAAVAVPQPGASAAEVASPE